MAFQMIFDYLLRQKFTIEDLETGFQENFLKVAKFYKLKFDTEYEKVLVIMKVHEYFLSAKVKQGSKPVLTVRDVSV